MLSELLSHIPRLNLEELRQLNKSVCNAIRGKHHAHDTKMASKFEKNARVLFNGRIYMVDKLSGHNLVTKCGKIIAMTQCRCMSKN